MATSVEEIVNVGDKITFVSDTGGSLSVDECGSIFWEIPEPGKKMPTNYDRCLWRICEKLSYADQELFANTTPGMAVSSSVAEKYDSAAAKKAVEREKSRNAVTLAKSGRPLLYGDVVQFQNVATGKYLAASTRFAKNTHTCLGVYLEDATSAVHFQVLPRYKVRSEGGSVLANDVLVLSSEILAGYSLHESVIAPVSAPLKPTKRKSLTAKSVDMLTSEELPVAFHEANMSKDSGTCGITVNVYEKSNSSGDQFLRIRQCVRFFDRENDGFISYAGVTDVTDKTKVDARKSVLVTGDDQNAAPPPNVPIVSKLHGDTAFNHPNEFRSDAVWVFEYAPGDLRRVGGLIEWETPQYRIKHVATGLYLTVAEPPLSLADVALPLTVDSGAVPRRTSVTHPEPDADVATNSVDTHLALTLEPSRSTRDTEFLRRQTFYIGYVDSKSDYVPVDDAFVTICHSNPSNRDKKVWYLHIPAGGEGGLVMSSVSYSYDAVLLVKVSNKQASVVRFLRGAYSILKRYVRNIENGVVNMSANSDRGLGGGDPYETERGILTRIVYGCLEYTGDPSTLEAEIEDDDDIQKVEGIDSEPMKLFQDCARYQFVLELILRIVAAPINVGMSLYWGAEDIPPSSSRGGTSSSVASKSAKGVSAMVKPKFAEKSVKTKSDWRDKKFKAISHLHKLAWTALTQLVRKNRENILYFCSRHLPYRSLSQGSKPTDSVAIGSLPSCDAFTIVIEQVPYPVGSALLLTTLIDDEKEILQKYVNGTTIEYFKKLISQFGPQAQFLGFYKAICSCRGEPLPQNQNYLLNGLINNVMHQKDNILLRLYTLPGHCEPRPAMDGEENEEDAEAIEKKLSEEDVRYLGMEDDLKSEGFPVVYVSWGWENDWKVNSPGLYHHPTDLGLDLEEVAEYHVPNQLPERAVENGHVRLEELAWVLNKEMYYERRYPGSTWRGGGEVEFESRDVVEEGGHELMAHYLHAQIEMLVQMMHGRNYNVIFTLEQMFPYYMLVAIISNDKIPYKLRSSFIQLMQAIWVDRFPNEYNCGRQQLPDVVWVYDNIQPVTMHDARPFPHFSLHPNNPLLKMESKPIYSINGTNKYKLLFVFINKFISEFNQLVVANIYQNVCIAHVMALVSNLASYGYYAETKTIAKLVSTLLPLLDGRGDLMEVDDELESYIVKTVPGVSSVSNVLRYKLTSQTAMVMNARASMLRAIHVVLTLRRQFRLHRFLHIFKECVKSNSLMPVASIGDIFDPEDDRFNQLYFDNLCDIPVNATLIDLMMNESVELFELTVQTLEAIAVPTKSLLEVAEKALLLKDDRLFVFGSLGELDDCISQLKLQFECAPVWGISADYVDPSGNFTANESFKRVWSIMSKLRCYIRQSPDKVVTYRRQMLLLNYDLHRVLMMPLMWSVAQSQSVSFGAAGNVFVSKIHSLYNVAVGSLEILLDLANDNDEVCTTLRSHVRSLVVKKDVYPQVIYQIVTEVHKTNSIEGVMQTPLNIFSLYSDILGRYDPVHMSQGAVVELATKSALEFFLDQLAPGVSSGQLENPVARNQLAVMDVFQCAIKKTSYASQSHYQDHVKCHLGVFDFLAIDSPRAFNLHASAINVLAHASRENSDVVSHLSVNCVPWSTAAIRLHSLLCHSNTQYVDHHASASRSPHRGGDNDSEDEDEMVLDVVYTPLNCYAVKQTSVASLNAYINYINWAFLDAISVDMSILFDMYILGVIAQLSKFIAENYVAPPEGKEDNVTEFRDPNLDSDDDSDAEPDPKSEEDEESEEEIEDILILKQKRSLTMRQLSTMSCTLRFFQSYVTAVANAKTVLGSDVTDDIYNACVVLYEEFTSDVTSICSKIGIGSDAIATDFNNLKRERAGQTVTTGDSGKSSLKTPLSMLRKLSMRGVSFAGLGGSEELEHDENVSPALCLAEEDGGGIAMSNFTSMFKRAAARKVFGNDDEKGQDVMGVHTQKKYTLFLEVVKNSKTIGNELQEDNTRLLNILLDAQKTTDPEDPSYKVAEQGLVGGALSGGAGLVGGALSGGAGLVGGALSGGVGFVGGALSDGAGFVGGALNHVGVGAVGDVLSGGAGFVGAGLGGVLGGGAGLVGGAFSGALSLLNQKKRGSEQRTNAITFEDVVVRMLRYVNHQIDIGGEHKVTDTVLNIFKEYLRHDDGTDKYDRQCRLNDLNVTKLVYRLVASYSEGPLFDHALELGELLLDEGNRECQDEFEELAVTSDKDGYFFAHLSGSFAETKQWILDTQYSRERAELIKKGKGSALESKLKLDGDMKTCIKVTHMLTQLCEGHNLRMQNRLRSQAEINRFSHNMVLNCVNLVELLGPTVEVYRHAPAKHMALLHDSLDFLIEACQGPCHENQVLISSYSMISVCKVFLTATSRKTKVAAELLAIKYKVITLIAAAIESRATDDPMIKEFANKLDATILDKVYEEVHFELFRQTQIRARDAAAAAGRKPLISEESVNLVKNYTLGLVTKIAVKQTTEDLDSLALELASRSESASMDSLDGVESDSVTVEDLTACICNILSIRLKLSANAGSVANESEASIGQMPRCHAVQSKGLGTVEVFWHGKSEIVTFPIPEDSKYLSNTTKKNFITTCELTSSDTRVRDLMKSRYDFLDEMEVLSSFSKFFLFILENYFNIKKLLFLLSLMLNFCLLITLPRGSKVIESVWFGTGGAARAMLIIATLVTVGYMAIASYWTQQAISFNGRRLNRTLVAYEEQCKRTLKMYNARLLRGGRGGTAGSEVQLSSAEVDDNTDKNASLSSLAVESWTGTHWSLGWCFRQLRQLVGLAPIAASSMSGKDSKKDMAFESEVREMYSELLEDNDEDDASNMVTPGKVQKIGPTRVFNWGAMRPFAFLIAMLALGCFVHYSTFYSRHNYSSSYMDESGLLYNYWLVCLIISCPVFVYCLRSTIEVPANRFLYAYCLAYDTLVDLNVLGHWVLVACMLCGIYGYIFLYCLTLLDFVTMSAHAKNTVKSVLIPWKPLVNVAMMFFIVIEIFGVFAYVRLNGTKPMMDGDESNAGDDDSFVACDSSWSCIGMVFYGGLISSDIASVLAQAQPGETEDGDVSFTSRFMFDVIFFIVVGALLFNMVTGIIVDTFSALREESQEITRLQTEETFIAGITRDMLEGVDGVTFDDIQEKHQNLWNYIYYSIYVLDRKPAEEYDGLETYVAECIHNEDTQWFPRKTCSIMDQAQARGADSDEEEESGRVNTDANTNGRNDGKKDKKQYNHVSEELKTVIAMLDQLLALHSTSTNSDKVKKDGSSIGSSLTGLFK